MNQISQKKFIYVPSDPLNGVFTYLLDSYKQKHISIFPVQVSSSGSSQSIPQNTINKSWQGVWVSDTDKKSWIQFDIKSYRLKITSYSLRVNESSLYCSYPKNWTLTGSNDNYKWDIIDEYVNSSIFSDEPKKIINFQCIPSKPYRIFRLSLIGKNSSGGHTLSLSNVEFYGTLTNHLKLFDSPSIS